MSLVNNMLRDLATQQRDHSLDHHDHDALLAESTLVRRKQIVWLPSVIVFVVVLSALFLAKNYLFTSENKTVVSGLTEVEVTDSEVTDYQETDAEKIDLESRDNETNGIGFTNSEADNLEFNNSAAKNIEIRNLEEKNIEARNGEQQTASGAVESFTEQPESEGSLNLANSVKAVDVHNETAAVIDNGEQLALQTRLDYLLLQAARALEQDRLTSPIEDNAYRYFQQALTLAPDNALAHVGMQRIAQRYLDLAGAALASNNYQRATVMVQRAEFVAPGYPELAPFKLRLSNTRLVTNEDDQAQVLALIPEVAESSPEKIEQAESVSVNPIQVAEANSAQDGVTRNPEWLDQNTATEFEQFLRQGQAARGEQLLQNFIATHPKPVKSAQALFEFYLQQKKDDKAQNVLQNARAYLPQVDHSRMTAQWLMAQGDYPAAIRVLEKDLPAAEKDEMYRSLLAGLYHKTERFTESASSYRRLLDSFGEKASYWLGLALALDALKQNASALEAYRRIPITASAQPAVKDYVEQRIRALSH